MSIVGKIEKGVNLFYCQILADLFGILEQFLEIEPTIPAFHGVILHNPIGSLAAGHLLGERQ